HGHDAEALGARSLVRQLVADGLPQSPNATVTIHLWACATGASVRTRYALWRKDPYALRFARALAGAGFNDYVLVGYVGFMHPNGLYSLSYHYKGSSDTTWEGNRHDAPTITFLVGGGGFNQVAGGEWKQYTKTKVHPIARRTSVVLSVRRG